MHKLNTACLNALCLIKTLLSVKGKTVEEAVLTDLFGVIFSRVHFKCNTSVSVQKVAHPLY